VNGDQSAVLSRLARQVGRRMAAQIRSDRPEDQPSWPTAEAVLIALLEGAEVVEQWGVRLTAVDGSGQYEDEWGDRTREFAESRVAHHHRMRARFPGGGRFGTERMWMVTPTLIHRLRLGLPAAEVEEDQ
jgi:hypothetical protein